MNTLRRALVTEDQVLNSSQNFWVCNRASEMHLRGSGHEVFCNRITALLSRSRALSRAFVVQRFLSDLGPHDNILQRLYQLSTHGNILLDLGSMKG